MSVDGDVSQFAQNKIVRGVGALSAVVAIPGFLISLPPVQNWLFDKKPKMLVSLESEIPIFDIKEPLKNLKVLYRGGDLTASKESLISARVRLTNAGGESLNPTDVTVSDPVGFLIRGAKVLNVSRHSTNSDHLKKLSKVIEKNGQISINEDLIFDPGDYIELEILLLKKRGASVTYDPIGKVSGQNSIEFTDRRGGVEEPPFVKKVAEGSWPVQLARFVIYPTALVGLISLISFLSYRARSRIGAKQGQKLLAASREVYEHITGRNEVAQAFAVGLFSAVGYQAFSKVVEAIKHDFIAKSNMDPLDEADMFTESVEARPKPIRDFIMRGRASISSAVMLAHAFDLIKGTYVHEDLVQVMDEILIYFKNAEEIKKIYARDHVQSFDVQKYLISARHLERRMAEREERTERRGRRRTTEEGRA